MAKKKKKPSPFGRHDFEFVRLSFDAMGWDLHQDLRDTITQLEQAGESYSDTTVAKHSRWLQFMQQRSNEVRDPLRRKQLRQYAKQAATDYLRWVMYFGYGEHNFAVWPELATALAATEFRCPRSVLQVPKPHCTLQLPRILGDQLRISFNEKVSWPTSSVWIGLGVSEDGERSLLTVTPVSRSDEDPRNAVRGAKYHYLINLNDAPDELTEDWVAAQQCRVSQRTGGDNQLLHWALNVLLYLQQDEADRIDRNSEFDSAVHQMRKSPKRTQRQVEKRARRLRYCSMLRSADVGKRFRLSHLSLPNTGMAGTCTVNHQLLTRGYWEAHPPRIGSTQERWVWVPSYIQAEVPVA